MAKLTKRAKAIRAKIDRQKAYALGEALTVIKSCAVAKFDESIDVAVQLGVDPKKSDQVVRGSVVLPAGTGRSVRVAVFTQGDKVEAARAAGADIVGMEDLAEQVKAGIVHASVGRASFGVEQLETNIKALVEALNRAKPQSSKGIYLRKVAVSSTMGVGVKVDPAAFSAAATAA